jgi:hypothetical protein
LAQTVAEIPRLIAAARTLNPLSATGAAHELPVARFDAKTPTIQGFVPRPVDYFGDRVGDAECLFVDQ